MYELYALTDVGRMRDHNEDCYLIDRLVSATGSNYETRDGDFLVAVADGVGGEKAGEVAARLALTRLSAVSLPVSNEELAETILQIHAAILEYGARNVAARGLGTTLAGLVCVENKVTVFNVGDSRVYRFRDGILKQLTTDHSLVQALLSAGQITRDEAFHHPQKHIVSQSLGGTTTVDRLQVDVETVRGVFEPGDLFLVCSDGMSDMVRDEEMEEIFINYKSVSETACALVARANEHGGHDNVTVIVVARS